MWRVTLWGRRSSDPTEGPPICPWVPWWCRPTGLWYIWEINYYANPLIFGVVIGVNIAWVYNSGLLMSSPCFFSLPSKMSQNVFLKTGFSSSDHLISHQFYIFYHRCTCLFSISCFLNEITLLFYFDGTWSVERSISWQQWDTCHVLSCLSFHVDLILLCPLNISTRTSFSIKCTSFLHQISIFTPK